MGATYRRRRKGERGHTSYLVTVHFNREREFATVYSEQDARDLVRHIHKQELAGNNPVEMIRKARTPAAAAPAAVSWPTVREALPEFIAQMAARGEWTGSTPTSYRRRFLAVRDWMGHASVEETEGYLHRHRTSHARAVDRLDSYVNL